MTESWSADEKTVMLLAAGRIAQDLCQRGSPGWLRFREMREQVAFHEAGHAAVALLLGRRPLAAVVEPRRGLVHFDEQSLLTGFDRPRRSDEEQISEAANSLAPGAVEELEARTKLLLEAAWPRVRAIAAALLDRGVLQGEEIMTLFFGRETDAGSISTMA